MYVFDMHYLTINIVIYCYYDDKKADTNDNDNDDDDIYDYDDNLVHVGLKDL